MLDKTIPYIGVLMTCPHPLTYPRFELPEGYTLRPYEPGMEKDWAALQVSVEQMDTEEQAIAQFNEEFLGDMETFKMRSAFIYGPNGKLAASGVLWYGYHFGPRRSTRLHWIAVAPEEQGKGLCKALMTILFDAYHTCGKTHGIYVTSQTWSYKALNIYRQFGFKPYQGPQPSGWKATTDDFEQETREAWDLIEKKHKAYRQQL